MSQTDNPWILFDADDTLIGTTLGGQIVGTSVAYDHVGDLFNAECVELGFDAKEAAETLREVDNAACQKHGFGNLGRFSSSFGLAYKQLSKKHGRKYRRGVAKKLESIGHSVFDFPAVALPGALEVLEAVKEHYRVAIVTKGNHAHQHKKVIDAGCHTHVEKVIVMEHKSVPEWLRLVVDPLGISQATRSSSWVIGDSVRSDINPALALGFNAIHVDTGLFDFERAEYVGRALGVELHVVNHVKEALKHLPLLQQ